MHDSWLLISFLAPMSNFASCFFHANRTLLIFGEMSRLMMFKPVEMHGTRLLLPFSLGILQLLEVVTEGQGEIELICLSILHSDDVVLFK